MTPAQFKLLFPEFKSADNTLVSTRIGWAQNRTPADIWGEKREQGIAFLTAHFLCLLPEARDLRKGEKPGETPYGRERMRLNKIVASGFRSAGVGESS